MSNSFVWPILRHILTAALILQAGAAVATEDGTIGISPFRLNGYGTLGYQRDNNDRLALIRDISQRPKNDSATGASWNLDSRIGLQMAYQFSPQVEGMAQVVLRDQVSNEFRHYVELAYLDFHLPSDTRLRLGRVGFDGFLMSDHRNLGYAYPWVRPPIEFYSWLPIFSLQGGDLTYEFTQEEAQWRMRAQIGKYDFMVPMGDIPYHFEAKPVWTLSLQREEGPWRFKVGYNRLNSINEVPRLRDFHAGLDQIANLGIPALAPISAEAAMLRRESMFKDQPIRYMTLGAAYDDGRWVGQAEIGDARTDNAFVPSTRNGYLALGRRFGKLMPYAMFSLSRPSRDRLRPQHDWSALGQAATELQSVAYNGVVNSTRVDQETLALGLRWDFHSRSALKLQWERTHIHPFGYAAWFRPFEIWPLSTNVDALTISLDFIF